MSYRSIRRAVAARAKVRVEPGDEFDTPAGTVRVVRAAGDDVWEIEGPFGIDQMTHHFLRDLPRVATARRGLRRLLALGRR